MSLHRHIYNTYKFDPFSGGFVEILAAQQTMQHESWYQGTADAVRRNIPYFTEKSYDLVLILSGDQLYRMDFQDMIRTHVENKADVTIAALPVAEAEARSCGIMRIQADGKVIDFEEKPKTQEKLNRVRTDPNWLEKLGLQGRTAGPTWPAWASTCSTPSPGRAARVERRDRLRPRALAPDDRQPPGPGPPLRRLLGRHRDRGRVPPGQHRPDARRPAVRLHLRRAARSSPGRATCPARGSAGRRSRTA